MKCNADVLSHTVDMLWSRDAGKLCKIPTRGVSRASSQSDTAQNSATCHCENRLCDCSTSATGVLRPKIVVSGGSREDDYHPADSGGALGRATSLMGLVVRVSRRHKDRQSIFDNIIGRN